MYCPSCGTPNQANAEKCVNCGKALPRVSPSGEPVPAGPASPVVPPASPAQWPPQPGQPYQPGLPGSQYSYAPAGPPPGPGGYIPPAFGSNPPGYYQGYPGGIGQPYVPYYNYSIPADRVGVAGAEAGFWPRLGAYIIDAIIVGLVTTVVFFVPFFAWLVNFLTRFQDRLLPVCDTSADGYNRIRCESALEETLLNNGELGTLLGVSLGLGLLALVLSLLYYTLLTMRGATIGKRVFGLKVITGDGTPPGFGRSLLRHTIGYWVSGAILYLGFIWIAFDPQKQGWHDKIAGTYVVRADY